MLIFYRGSVALKLIHTRLLQCQVLVGNFWKENNVLLLGLLVEGKIEGLPQNFDQPLRGARFHTCDHFAA